jgi:hypothetical protein
MKQSAEVVLMDLSNERLIPLARASQAIPSRPHASTAVRWARRGVRGVKLETILIGGRRFTSHEAIGRFVSRLSEPQPAELPASTTDRERELQGAEQELDLLGF